MSFEKGLIVEKSDVNSLEAKVYNIVNSLEEFLPIPNDRNRLSYDLIKQKRGEGDPTLIVLKKNKLTIKSISLESLTQKIDEQLAKIS